MRKIISFILLVSFTNHLAAQMTSYNYDSLDRLTQIIYPDSSFIIYTYDASGNRISKNVTKTNISFACPEDNVTFYAGLSDTTKNYQWQADTSGGFFNLLPDTIYIGVDSSTLTLNSPPTNFYNYKYRCIITDTIGQTISPVFTLRFEISWIGVADTAWENTANWSCGTLPDRKTDVIVKATAPRFPQVNSNAFCRSVSLQYGATIIVKTGFQLNTIGK